MAKNTARMRKADVPGVKRMWYVWGVGGASSTLVRSAEAADTWPEQATRVCREAAGEDGHGDPGGWCVEVEATQEDLDAATRFDRAVLGFAERLGLDASSGGS